MYLVNHLANNMSCNFLICMKLQEIRNMLNVCLMLGAQKWLKAKVLKD